VDSYVVGTEQTNVTTRSIPPGTAALTTTRVLSGIMAALVFFQGALAGSHLTGAAGTLDMHRVIGTQVLTLLGLATVVTAAVAARRNRWVLPTSILALLALGTQIGMGFQDRLNVHLPLGIALFGVYLTMALVLKDESPTRTKEENK
jgi:hypothetical protein